MVLSSGEIRQKKSQLSFPSSEWFKAYADELSQDAGCIRRKVHSDLCRWSAGKCKVQPSHRTSIQQRWMEFRHKGSSRYMEEIHATKASCKIPSFLCSYRCQNTSKNGC